MRVALGQPLGLAACFVLLSAPVQSETAAQHLLEQKLYAGLHQIDSGLDGVLGVATIDLTSGRVFVYNGDVVFPTASSIKIPIMVEMYRSNVDLDRSITLNPADAVGGSGILQNRLRQAPVTLTIRELIRDMIEGSDNTATNRAIALVGISRVNALLASLGFRSTRLRRIMMDTAASARGDENISTPLEMARLVEMLYRHRLASPAQSGEMLGLMKLVKAGMRKAIPPEIEVASKPGEINGVSCEAGMVYLPGRPFVISVFSTFLNAGIDPVDQVTRQVFGYFNKLAESNQYGVKVK
jgi:beta-lactamase class A